MQKWGQSVCYCQVWAMVSGEQCFKPRHASCPGMLHAQGDLWIGYAWRMSVWIHVCLQWTSSWTSWWVDNLWNGFEGLGYMQGCWVDRRAMLDGSPDVCVLVNMVNAVCVPPLLNVCLYQPKRGRGLGCLCQCFTWLLCVSVVDGSTLFLAGLCDWSRRCAVCLCLWDMNSISLLVEPAKRKVEDMSLRQGRDLRSVGTRLGPRSQTGMVLGWKRQLLLYLI